MWWKVGSGSTGGLLDNRPIPTAMKLPDSTGKQANSGAARTLKRVCCYTNKHGQMRTYPERRGLEAGGRRDLRSNSPRDFTRREHSRNTNLGSTEVE